MEGGQNQTLPKSLLKDGEMQKDPGFNKCILTNNWTALWTQPANQGSLAQPCQMPLTNRNSSIAFWE